MTTLHIVLGTAMIVVNALAAAWGGWSWWRGTASRAFWPLLRVGQGLVMVEAVQGAILVAMGEEIPELHLVYGLVPIGVAFLAEQLRLATADTVLEQRGLEGRADVERLTQPEQRALVLAIVQREMGVMAASAGVVALLGVRAAGLL
jgi:TRAP-type C4-dicarboxylate transport system permease small subunit